MKSKLISISAIAAVATAVSNIWFIGTVHAQTDTGIGSNPHLRSQSAPTASPGATVVKMSQKDVNFIQKAAGGGAQEVENGKSAEREGKSADVKRIGARMVADHTRANKELTALANGKGVTFDVRGIKAQNFGTADFDRQYLGVLEEVLKNDIAEFEKEAKNGEDRGLKAWASKTLPMLKEQLAMVKSAMKK
jgi:putative membrane protein